MNALQAWFLTVLVHGTLLVVVVGAVVRFAGVRSLAVREALWTVALFGAPITGTVSHLVAPAPLFGVLELGFGERGTEPVGPGARPAPLGVDPLAGPEGPSSATRGAGGGRAPSATSSLRDDPAAWTSGPIGDGWVWLVPAVSLGLVLLLLRSLRGLAHRRRLDDGPLVVLLERLRAAHGPRRRVRLSTSERIASPVAFGVFAPEICVPVRALVDLTKAQQEAMLAHELAHVVRHDPARLLLARLVEAIFFLQPLYRVARRRLFETVERRCDAWALRRTGRGLALAECLAEVAGWMNDRHVRRVPRAAVSMAASGSPLARRIEGLLAPERTLQDDRRWLALAPLATLLLPTLVLAAPAVRAASPGEGAPAARPAPVVASDPAASARGADDVAVAAAVAAAIELLEEETQILAEEVEGLRAALPPGRIEPDLARSLTELERRVERLKSRRDRLAAWKDTVLREHGLARTQPRDRASPRSEGR